MSQLKFDQLVTRSGDQGESSLYSGERLPKDDVVFQVLGEADELNALIGLAKHGLDSDCRVEMETIQTALGELMALVATCDGRLSGRYDLGNRLAWLELRIQERLVNTVIQTNFVNPGATAASAMVDVARAVCRRAERQLVGLIRQRQRSELAAAQIFLNRLSDYLFVLARHVEQPS